MRNFINQGVNAIIINPNSPTAFDPIFAQAKARGILVVATDAEVSSKDAIYVGIDQKGWAMQSAEWLAKALGGKGSLVAINGVAGHPANQMRVDGYREVFAKHPDIKILNEANANWDEAQGQQTAQTLLATYPDLNGIWVQDGMAAGAWRAVAASGRKDIAATGEIRGRLPEGVEGGRLQLRRVGEPARRHRPRPSTSRCCGCRAASSRTACSGVSTATPSTCRSRSSTTPTSTRCTDR